MSDHKYPQVVRAVLETPWAILPSKLLAILEMVALRASGEHFTDEEILARIGTGPARRDIYMAGPVAVLPLYGVIVPKADALTQMSGGTSAQTFAAAFQDAVGNDDVKAIVLDVDSPGGSTDLMTETATEIRAARGKKPIVAVANTMATSAAYWLGAQADEFVVTPSGKVGSIGVFAAHDDISAMQEIEGVKTTLISAGKHKTEGNPFEPLSEEAHAAIQERVDDAYGQFVADVAKGRGVPADTVKNGFGEGRVVMAKKALTEGMVDRIGTLDATIARLANAHGRSKVGTASSSSVSFTHTGAISGTGSTALPSQWERVRLVDPAAGPLRAHTTPTSEGPWDNAGNKARLRNNGDEPYYRSAFAWQDDSADATLKGSYKFIHHEVNDDGDVGAANLLACSQGIGVLNGGRVGTTIPDADRQGVYDHLARHIRDGGKEPPPLQSLSTEAADSGLSFADTADDALRALDAVVSRSEALRVLTGPKREQLASLRDAIDELLAQHDPDQRRNSLASEHARFLALNP